MIRTDARRSRGILGVRTNARRPRGVLSIRADTRTTLRSSDIIRSNALARWLRFLGILTTPKLRTSVTMETEVQFYTSLTSRGCYRRSLRFGTFTSVLREIRPGISVQTEVELNSTRVTVGDSLLGRSRRSAFDAISNGVRVFLITAHVFSIRH